MPCSRSVQVGNTVRVDTYMFRLVGCVFASVKDLLQFFLIAVGAVWNGTQGFL